LNESLSLHTLALSRRASLTIKIWLGEIRVGVGYARRDSSTLSHTALDKEFDRSADGAKDEGLDCFYGLPNN